MATLLSINNCHYYRHRAETALLEHNRMLEERPDIEFEHMGWYARTRVTSDFTAGVYRNRILAIYRELGVRVSESLRLLASV